MIILPITPLPPEFSESLAFLFKQFPPVPISLWLHSLQVASPITPCYNYGNVLATGNSDGMLKEPMEIWRLDIYPNISSC